MAKQRPLSTHAWEMLAVVDKRTTPAGVYWVPNETREHVDRRLGRDGNIIVSGSTTVCALRALERRGLIVQTS